MQEQLLLWSMIDCAMSINPNNGLLIKSLKKKKPKTTGVILS